MKPCFCKNARHLAAQVQLFLLAQAVTQHGQTRRKGGRLSCPKAGPSVLLSKTLAVACLLPATVSLRCSHHCSPSLLPPLLSHHRLPPLLSRHRLPPLLHFVRCPPSPIPLLLALPHVSAATPHISAAATSSPPRCRPCVLLPVCPCSLCPLVPAHISPPVLPDSTLGLRSKRWHAGRSASIESSLWCC